jgi:hypothetical protein
MMRVAVATTMAMLVACRPSRPEPLVPATVRFLPRTAWGARAPVLPMTPHRPTRITIHHTATRVAPTRALAEKMQALQRFSQREDSLADGRRKRQWADIPYHMYIAVDGEVAEGREWKYVGDSNTPYDPTGHYLIVLEGSFDTDTLTTGQRRALDALVVAAAARWNIAPARLGAHRDYAQTRCPGRHVYAELPRLRALISSTRSRPLAPTRRPPRQSGDRALRH